MKRTVHVPLKLSALGEDSTVTVLYGRTLGRQTLLYAAGMAGAVPLALLSLAVITRYLDASDYGRLATLFALSSVLTVLGGAGVLQGMLVTVFRIADSDEEGDGAEVAYSGPASPEQSVAEKRRLLRSGLLLCALLALAVCSIAAALASPIASIFLGDAGSADAVRVMTLSAWVGSVWRAVHQLFRVERRPAAWSVFQVFRPTLVVALVLGALVAGWGLAGVLLANAAGTAATIGLGLWANRRLIVVRPKAGDASTIWRAGLPMLPIVLVRVVQSNLSVLVLSLITTPAGVGIYYAASRIAQVPNYFGSAFLLGWAPMERSPISMAASDRKGRRAQSATVFSMFFLALLTVGVAVSLLSRDLVSIAAPAYADAASLVPIICLGLSSHLVFTGIFRATAFPGRRWWFALLHLVWLAPYAGIALLIAPSSPSYGVALAEVGAGITVTLIMLSRDRRASEPTPFPWPKLATALGVGASAVALVKFLAVPGIAHAFLAALVLSALPVALVRSRAVTRPQAAMALRVVSHMIPRPMSNRDLLRRLHRLPAGERDAIALVIWSNETHDAAARSLGIPPNLLLARLARGLVRFCGQEQITHQDHLLGMYAARTATTLEHDETARFLHDQGVDGLDLHRIDDAIEAVERVRRRALLMLASQPSLASSRCGVTCV